MNNTTNSNETIPHFGFFSKEQWFTIFGSVLIQEIINISIIPIGIFGMSLNIVALIVLRSHEFNLPFYTYLRAHTLQSVFICFLSSTHFTIGCRNLLSFTNSKFSFQWYVHVVVPFINITTLYGSLLGIILSMERIILLSNQLKWFRKINANLVCVICAFIPFVFFWPLFSVFRENSAVVYLNETTPFTIYYFYLYYSSKSMEKYIKENSVYIIDLIPAILGIVLSIITIILVKRYRKRKMNLTGTSRTAKTSVSNQNATGNNTPVDKTKRMEIRLTVLVLILTFLTTM
jgi:hypothetical protein